MQIKLLNIITTGIQKNAVRVKTIETKKFIKIAIGLQIKIIKNPTIKNRKK